MKRATTAGITTIELLVALPLGLGVIAGLLTGAAVGVRLLTHTMGRAEIHDIADLTIDAFRFDLRRTGFAPTITIADPIPLARSDRITLRADLDGNGTIDTSSEETVSIACLTSPARVSRIVGSQSLPLANDVVSCGLRYFANDGTQLVPGGGGLSTLDRQRVAAVALAFTLESPWLHYRASRDVFVSRPGAL